MEYRKSRIYDVADVLDDVSEVTRAEFEESGIPIPQIADFAAYAVGHGECFTVEADGKPIAMFWFFPQAGETETSFIAAAPFFAQPLPAMRIARRLLADMHRRHYLSRFVAYTTSPHPKVVRFFHALGFAHTRGRGKAKRFDFQPVG